MLDQGYMSEYQFNSCIAALEKLEEEHQKNKNTSYKDKIQNKPLHPDYMKNDAEEEEDGEVILKKIYDSETKINSINHDHNIVSMRNKHFAEYILNKSFPDVQQSQQALLDLDLPVRRLQTVQKKSDNIINLIQDVIYTDKPVKSILNR